MKRDSGVKSQGPEKLFDQTHIEVSGGILFEINPIGEKRPVGDVQDDPSQCFIHWNGRFPVTPYSLFFTQRLMKGQPEANTQVLDRMVVVNFGITPTLYGKLHETVGCH